MRTVHPAHSTTTVLAASVLCLLAGTSQLQAQSIFTRWEVAEFQPDIPNGGRANTFAVHPTHVNRIHVTAETGGLFRSTNRGVTWRHVDALPSFRTASVAYLPADPNIVLATTTDDFQTTTGGGIWRSTDGGLNWGQASVSIPAGITTGRLSTYEISVAPDNGDIYVGSSYGVLKSTTQGTSWTYQDVFGGGDRNVYSVVALGGDRVIAAGPAGVRRSDGGTTWLSPTPGVGAISDLHALGRSPLSNMQAFVVDAATRLFHTEDAGQTWTQVASAPGGGGRRHCLRPGGEPEPGHRMSHPALRFVLRQPLRRVQASRGAKPDGDVVSGAWQGPTRMTGRREHSPSNAAQRRFRCRDRRRLTRRRTVEATGRSRGRRKRLQRVVENRGAGPAHRGPRSFLLSRLRNRGQRPLVLGHERRHVDEGDVLAKGSSSRRRRRWPPRPDSRLTNVAAPGANFISDLSWEFGRAAESAGDLRRNL